MRVVCAILLAVFSAGILVGCSSAPTISDTVSLERQENYQRLAIVCAPKEGVDPGYASVVLQSAKKNIPSRLGFLKKVECLPDVSADTSSVPPKVNLNNIGDYDAVVCLVYSYNSGNVCLDFHVLDTRTNEQIWHHQLATKDPDVRGRLSKHGYWVPTTLKMNFYGYNQ